MVRPLHQRYRIYKQQLWRLVGQHAISLHQRCTLLQLLALAFAIPINPCGFHLQMLQQWHESFNNTELFGLVFAVITPHLQNLKLAIEFYQRSIMCHPKDDWTSSIQFSKSNDSFASYFLAVVNNQGFAKPSATHPYLWAYHSWSRRLTF